MYLREIHDEIICIGLFGGLDDILHGDPCPPVTDVLCDRGGEEHRLLLHNTNQRTQPLDVQTPNIMAIQGHLRCIATKDSSFS